LTDTAIRNSKPGNKPKRMFDERGLYVEISPSGGKWWRLKSRIGGQGKAVVACVYPDVKSKDTRERRDSCSLMASIRARTEGRYSFQRAAGNLKQFISRPFPRSAKQCAPRLLLTIFCYFPMSISQSPFLHLYVVEEPGVGPVYKTSEIVDIRSQISSSPVTFELRPEGP
jgi:hypothetical protein